MYMYMFVISLYKIKVNNFANVVNAFCTVIILTYSEKLSPISANLNNPNKHSKVVILDNTLDKSTCT